MAGLIDSDAGLTFGTGLQWDTAIGGPGLTISTEVSAAAALLAQWGPDGLALCFDDDFFYDVDGFNGSAAIKGGGTQNNYNSSPVQTASSLLAYTSPSVKMTMGPEGLLRCGAHNFIKFSEDISNVGGWTGTNAVWTATAAAATTPDGVPSASIVAVAGMTKSAANPYTSNDFGSLTGASYTLDFDIKSVGFTLWVVQDGSGQGGILNFSTGVVTGLTSGAGTMTEMGDGWWRVRITLMSGATAFYFYMYSADGGTAAGTETIYCTKVHVRRTPSDPTYLQTAGSARYDLPYQWDQDGDLEGILVEEQRTNAVTYSNDWTQGMYSGTRITSAKNATGPDGVANSASTLTATGANGFRYVAAFYGSVNTTRTQSFFARRKTGTGPVFCGLGLNYSYLPTSAPTTTGSNLITNGDFSGGATGWTTVATSGGDTVTFDGSNARIVTTTTTATAFYQNVSATPGKTYLITFTATIASGRADVGYTNGIAAGGFGATGTYSVLITAAEANLSVYFGIGTSTSDVTYDNVSCLETTIDNSVSLSTTEWTRIDLPYLTHPGGTSALGGGFLLTTSGDAIEVAYCQNEAGAFATSPIETFGATVTRAADNISLATAAFPTASEQTFYAKARILTPQYSNRLIGVQGAITPMQGYGSATFVSAYDGADIAVFAVANIVAAAQKMALAGDATDSTFVTAGGAAQNAPDIEFAQITTFAIGHESNSLQWNGVISEIAYFPRRLSNAELQALTGA